MMLVRGRQLVQQAHERLFRERVPHGVIMNNHAHQNQSELIQLCSVDTLRSKRLRPKASLIVVDEAHLATSASFREILSDYPDTYILAVSATPFVDESLTHLAETVVKPITLEELTQQGFLVPLRYYAPSTPDLSKVKTTAGDFNAHDLSQTMQKSSLTGSITEEWKKHGQGRPTVVFAVDVAHAKLLAQAFNDMNIPAAHVDASTPLAARGEKIDMLRTGELQVLTNCGVLTVGVDMPHVSCLVLARPTKSYNLHIQMLGRGTRPYSSKADCLILDHAGNVTRHGFINEEREADLAGKKDGETRPAATTCYSCYAVFYSNGLGVCPECREPLSDEQKKKSRTLKRIDGELVEITELTLEQKAERDLALFKKEQRKHKHGKNWVYFQMWTRYGPELTKKLMPPRIVPAWVARKI